MTTGVVEPLSSSESRALTTAHGKDEHDNTGAIIGGVVGAAVAGVLLLALGVGFCKFWRRDNHDAELDEHDESIPTGPQRRERRGGLFAFLSSSSRPARR